MTYVPILIVGFSFWCVWAMVMFPPVCLKWNQKFLFLYFLTSWLQIPKQTEPQFLWDCFLFSIIWASYKKKILNLNYILGCPKEVSKWVITYNLLINGVFLGVITHWSDHLWSWLPTGHPSKGARWNWGRENSLTKTPRGVDGKNHRAHGQLITQSLILVPHFGQGSICPWGSCRIDVRMAWTWLQTTKKTHTKSKRFFFSGEKKKGCSQKKYAANFWTDIFRRSIHPDIYTTSPPFCVFIPVPWCVPSKDAQRQISKLVAHLITDITRSLAYRVPWDALKTTKRIKNPPQNPPKGWV